MVSSRLVKLVVFELLELAAFSVPTLVVMEQFAAALQGTRNKNEKPVYWLGVSCSIAYVALVVLVVWVPVKVLLYRKHHLQAKIRGWSPVMLMCVVLSTLPCFAFSIAVTEVQKSVSSSSTSTLPETLPDFQVSLVLTSLIIVDIIEKLRKYPLRGRPVQVRYSKVYLGFRPENIDPKGQSLGPAVTESLDDFNYSDRRLLTGEDDPQPQQQIRSVSEQVASKGSTPTPFRSQVINVEEPPSNSRVMRVMSRQDERAQIFLMSFVTWSDTIEMVRVAGHPAVFGSAWVFPVYIFSCVSLIRIILLPNVPVLGAVGVVLQDFPFIFVRLGLIAALGTITPVLGLFKNILVTGSFIYFNYFINLRFFSVTETLPF
ncbi:transmembrane protein 236 [Tachyglossus aculeatus]|uniref:transmembrane protein 236 n=1 Tax=Tachyglossus aculeatus TaxID=9261 RepID=UPI0018F6C25F|nr:transmembrane protein 236 [Tachyglossus aculeatus]